MKEYKVVPQHPSINHTRWTRIGKLQAASHKHSLNLALGTYILVGVSKRRIVRLLTSRI